ncbi:MAG: aldehyde ferredoxin oxidoreductase N-terminal domain-containing protein [Candidatus Thorarchaeota archaeon]
MLSTDPLRRILHIDLSRRKFWIDERPELFEENLGGVGVAIQLLEEECASPKNVDPLGPDNPIIFAVGPLVGHFPLASKTVALFKSPHTKNLGESHSGGRSAVSIRFAGYGAIVIRGISPKPVYLAIKRDKVHFRDGTGLWGLRSSFTVGDVLREREAGSGLRTIMRIGGAGEQKVSYATVVTETYRHFGRLGLGAVFGSKKLKALVITGKRSLPLLDRKAYRKAYDQIFEGATKSNLMKKYHDLGTAMNIHPLNEIGGLPTRNLQTGNFEEAEALSGENLAEKYLGRRLACAHCPVACIHLAAIRLPHPKEPYFYKTSMIGYDYEPIFALGTMLGIPDAVELLQLMDEVEIWGLDAMSTGVVLSWATEAFEKNLITSKETDGLHFEWGKTEVYREGVRKIVKQPTDLYAKMAQGVEEAASKYGGLDFALAFGGNEMPGYHTGPASHINHLIGSRHSHLDSGGYSLDQKMLKQGKILAPIEIASTLLEEERWRQVLSSLVVCFFARGLYTQDTIITALSTIGFEVDANYLTRLGKDTLKRKYRFKKRAGFDPDSLRIPKRIFETPSPLGDINEDTIRKAISHYVQAI